MPVHEADVALEDMRHLFEKRVPPLAAPERLLKPVYQAVGGVMDLGELRILRGRKNRQRIVDVEARRKLTRSCPSVLKGRRPWIGTDVLRARIATRRATFVRYTYPIANKAETGGP